MDSSELEPHSDFFTFKSFQELQLQAYLAKLQCMFHFEVQKNKYLNSNEYKETQQRNSDKQVPVKIEENVKFEEHQQLNEGTLEPLKLQQLQRRKGLNETKNIPKNFGKAIIKFVGKNPAITKKCLGEENIGNYSDFMQKLKMKKKLMSSILHLRALWLDSEFEYALTMRKISLVFIKRYSWQYIFSSRITNYGIHIKYRQRMLEAIKNPEKFTYVKNF